MIYSLLPSSSVVEDHGGDHRKDINKLGYPAAFGWKTEADLHQKEELRRSGCVIYWRMPGYKVRVYHR